MTVGFSCSGSGLERPVVVGSGSLRATDAMGSETLFGRKGLAYVTTVPGAGLYACTPELGAREGC